MIGILGYGFVGKAVDKGFSKVDKIISDPLYNDISIQDMVSEDPEAIIVCLPTPTVDSEIDTTILINSLDIILKLEYNGLIVIKSTVLPSSIEGYDVVCVPEFLSRATAYHDFINPEVLIIGGSDSKRIRTLNMFKEYSDININKVHLTDIKTACLLKYTMNTFNALKITYLNEIYKVCEIEGIEYSEVSSVLAQVPRMGKGLFDVPGPDGKYGFGGPCLPKDAECFANTYNIDLIKTMLEVNSLLRN